MSSVLPCQAGDPRVHLPSLLTGLVIMVGGTINPLLMATAAGSADYPLAALLSWAMSAGFVRGVGFIPRAAPARWLLSGWACVAALVMAGTDVAIRLA